MNRLYGSIIIVFAAHDLLDRFKISVSPFHVGFEVAALYPFIPCIQDNQGRLFWPLIQEFPCLLQVHAKAFG